MRSRPLVASFALFALALVVPLATVAAVATRWYVALEQERLRTTVSLISETMRERVDHDLSRMEAIARTLATSPSIEADDFHAFRAQALASVDADSTTVTLAELDGRQLVNTRAPADESLPTMARPNLIARVTDTRRPVFTGVMTSALTGHRIVSVVAPVIRDGMVVRIVAVVVRVEYFEALIRSPQLAAPYWMAVVDRDGTVIAGTGGPRVTAKDGAKDRSKNRAKDGANGEAKDGPEGGRLDAAAETEATHGLLQASQISRLADWRLAAGIDRAALEAPLRHSLLLLVGLAVSLVGLGAWLALRLARRIAGAAARLAAKAEAIGRGETVAAQDSVIREVRIVEHALALASRTLAEQRAALAAAQGALEARVEASQSRYRVLAENVCDIIIVRRIGSHEASYVSPSFERTLGYPDEMRTQLTLADFVHPDDLPIVAGLDAALGAGERHYTGLFRARHRDGRWVWLEGVASRIGSAGPGEPDLIVVMRDVTARKQQADELRIACDMAELAKARAENASRAKSEFLAMMSHEIRTPLATIRGYTDLLDGSGPLSDEQARYLALVSDATGTMLTAVDDILDFARVESGDFHLQEESFPLAETVEGVAAFVRPVAADKGVTLGLTIDPNLPKAVRGDPRRLRQILLNLLNAALRDRRGGLVTLSLYALRGAENRISFALTGSGGHARPAERDGLGLAIAGRLVGRMGGRLEKVSFAGEAASYRFGLQLPAAEAEAPGTAAAAETSADTAAALPETTAASGLRGAKILLVEDHAINQEMTRRILERQGFRVDVVDDGAAALAAVQARIYDLVLMDVQMPGMDGLTATRRIRALPHPSRHLPIVALTAEVLPEQVRAIMEAGMNAHLAKPIDREQLRAAIAGQLSGVMLAEIGAPAPAPLPAIDRTAYDRLAAALGPESARRALRGFVALLDATFANPATLRAEAGTLAAGARRFGLADLGSALDLMAEDGGGDEVALRRCHVARDLVGRSMDELVGVEPVEVSALIAHL